MLQVLGRSATGQKLTVYSNVMSGPRRYDRDSGEAESDGPDALARGPCRQRPQQACRIGSRRDPVLHPLRRVPQQVPRVSTVGRARLRQHLSRSGRRGADAGAAGPASVARFATGQQPLRRLPRGLSGPHRHPAHAARASRQDDEAGADAELGDVRLTVFRQIATRPALFRRAQALASWATRRMATDGWIKSLPGHMARWTKKRDFPAFATRTFQQQWRRASDDRQPR